MMKYIELEVLPSDFVIEVIQNDVQGEFIQKCTCDEF